MSRPGASPITSWQWDFGDGTTSTAQHPGKLYNQEGTYTVKLTVNSATGNDTEIKQGFVIVGEGDVGPTAAFTFQPNGGVLGPVGINIRFLDQSNPGSSIITDWEWKLTGEDNDIFPNSQFPFHHFFIPGIYHVTLKVTTAVGSDTSDAQTFVIEPLPITCPTPLASCNDAETDRLIYIANAVLNSLSLSKCLIIVGIPDCINGYFGLLNSLQKLIWIDKWLEGFCYCEDNVNEASLTTSNGELENILNLALADLEPYFEKLETGEISQEEADEIQQLLEDYNIISEGAYTTTFLDLINQELNDISRVADVEPKGPILYAVSYQGSIIRGKTSQSGNFEVLIGNNTPFGVTADLFDPIGWAYASTTVFDPPSPGGQFTFPDYYLRKLDNNAQDTDNDGLPDVAEFVVGTDPDNPDTDGDGSLDGDEVILGTDPLARPIQINDIIIGEISTPSQEQRYTFTTQGGKRIFFDEQGAAGGLNWKVEDESGALIFDQNLSTSDAGVYALELGGTYRITVYSSGTGTGNFQFQLWDEGVETFAINIDDVISDGIPELGAGNIEVPVRQDVYTFTATAGQPVFFDSQGTSSSSLRWRAVDSNETVLFDDISSYSDPGVFTLDTGGVYTVTFYSPNNAKGTYQFRIWDLSPEVFAINIDDVISNGNPVPEAGNIDVPYGRDAYVFTALPGQKVYFDSRGTNASGLRWRAVDRNGDILFDDHTLVSGSDPGVIILEAGGTYTITAYSTNVYGGNYGFKVWDLTPDVFPINIGDAVSNGNPETGAGNIQAPLEEDIYTFTASLGQEVYFDSQGTQYSGTLWRAVDNNGVLLFDSHAIVGGSDPGLFTLELGGTYTVTVYNSLSTSTNSNYSFQVWNVTPDEFSINIGDTVSNGNPEPGAGVIESPLGQDRYTFTATPGQQVYFEDQGSTSGIIFWRTTNEDGDILFDESILGSDPGAFNLSLGGAYTITVYQTSALPGGSYSFRIFEQ